MAQPTYHKQGLSELHPTLAALQLIQADLVLLATCFTGAVGGC